jgi:hypothetical protein
MYSSEIKLFCCLCFLHVILYIPLHSHTFLKKFPDNDIDNVDTQVGNENFAEIYLFVSFCHQ